MQKLSYKSLFIIIAFLLIPIIFLFRINQKPSQVLADWFNDAWAYRQAINVSSHTAGETNVYIITSVNIGATNKAQSDDGDFRFTTASGQLLDYYISAGVGTTNVTFHIKFDSFPSGAQTIYVYYGNPTAPNGFMLTDFTTQAASYALGSAGTEQLGGGPVAYWKFDEGVGTSTFDSTSNKNNGVISGATWQTEDKCISGKCLYLTGSNTITIPDAPNNTLNFGTDSFTISTWVRTGTSADNRNLIRKGAGAGLSGWRFGLQTGVPHMLIGGPSGGTEGSVGSTSIADNKWHLVTVVYNRGGNSVGYVDGIYAGAANISSVSGSVDNATSIFIGNTYGTFTGFLDDIKMYNYARSVAQIKSDYTSGIAGQSTAKGANANLGGLSNKSLTDGLVGYWKMDEGVGTTSADSSGNSNLATFGAGSSAPSWSNGKYGVGVSFNGVDEKLTIGNNSVLNPTDKITVGLWFKKGTANTTAINTLISKGNSGSSAAWETYSLYFSNDNKIYWRTSNGSSFDTIASAAITDTNWHYVIATWDNLQSSSSINIYLDGVRTSGPAANTSIQNRTWNLGLGFDNLSNRFFYDGLIDEVRIYNRALNPIEVKALYDYAPGPIGYWKFEEGTGIYAQDTSGNNLLGTLNNGPIWSSGKYGKALTFNRTNSQSVTYSTTSLVPSSRTITMWLKPNFNGNDGLSHTLWEVAGGCCSANQVLLFKHSGNLLYWRVLTPAGVIQDITVAADTTNFLAGRWMYVTATYEPAGMKLYINGILVASSAGAITIPTANAASYGTIGNGAYGALSGVIDDVKIYNYARTQEQILQDMGGSNKLAGPIAYYKFDEGQGTVVNNSGLGTSLNGAIIGSTLPTWSALGKINKTIDFSNSGSNALINITTNSQVQNFTQKTVSFWIYPKSFPGATKDIFTNGYWTTPFGDLIRYGTGGAVLFYWKNSAGTVVSDVSTLTTTAGQWTHVSYSWDGSFVKLYKNGIFVSSIGFSGILGCSGENIQIGNYVNTQFPGYIDELKVYNYALSADEIKSDYNAGASVVVSSSNQTIGATSTSLDYCVPGDTSACASPIAEWKFEEGTGTTAFDGSGNGYNGMLAVGSSAPAWTPGKISKGLQFSSSNSQYVQVSSNFGAPNILSLSLWFKTGTSDVTIIGQGNTLPPIAPAAFIPTIAILPNGSLRAEFYTSSSVGLSTPSPVNNNQWNHIELVSVGTSQSLYLNGTLVNSRAGTVDNSWWTSTTIGTGYMNSARGGSTTRWNYFNGQIDQVRIYNYARTPAQVAYDYNKGAPIALWKFDECQGNVSNNSSGIGFSGSITIGAAGTQSSLGTCTVGTGISSAWTNGATGKFNASLNFDGTDDYVLIPGLNSYNLSNFTTSAWIKTSSAITTPLRIISQQSGIAYWVVYLNNLSLTYLGKVDGAAVSKGQALNDNKWHMVTIVRDAQNTTISFYIDGINAGSTATANTTYSVAADVAIGGSNTQYFPGQIDDVRIYNYALTSTQIKSVYNYGSVNFD